MLLGCIADDFTGATDLGNTLARQGMATVQTIGIPDAPPGDAEAVVVALKSRTIPVEEAVAQSLAACRWLKQHGARQIFFKYCSTFDSTNHGNIGPVADALLDELGGKITTVCPAFPENGRTVYLGHLFVGPVLLSQSSMRDHPLTPMRDANLVAVMARQSRYPTGNIAYPIVRKGAAGIAAALRDLAATGVRHAVIDALMDEDLLALGEACADVPLVTGGSGAALGLPGNFRRLGLLPERAGADPLPAVGGPAIVLAGSCSAATRVQVAAYAKLHPSRKLMVENLFRDSEDEIAAAVRWAGEHPNALMYTTAEPDKVAAIQAKFGSVEAGVTTENAFAAIARQLSERGVRRFVVAGGETAGAVTKALGVKSLRIGEQIAPGVPATVSRETPRYALALKSGNFGDERFFFTALEMLK